LAALLKRQPLEVLMPRYGRKASQKVEKTMHEMKRGTLRSGHQPEAGDRDRFGAGAA